MKKLRNALFSVLQVLVIAAILFVIFFGLHRLDLVTLPEPLAALFRKKDDGYIAPSGDASDEEARVGVTYEPVDLSRDAARDMLESITPPPCYTVTVDTSLYAGGGSYTEQIVIRHDADCDAAYVLDGGHVTKQVLCDGKTVQINSFEGETKQSAAYAVGDVTFEQQIGTVYTHTSFLDKVSDEAYTFELLAEDEDVFLYITYDDTVGSYVQQQRIRLDPDTGIVVEATGSENGQTVFGSVVTSFAEELTEPISIPEPYLALEAELFSAKEQQEQQE